MFPHKSNRLEYESQVLNVLHSLNSIDIGDAADVTPSDRVVRAICERLGLSDRAARRRPLRVAMRVTDGSDERRGVTRDVGTQGCFVATPDPYPESRAVQTHVKLSGGTRQLPGTVVRCVMPAAPSGHLAGMAIRFAADHHLTAAEIDDLSVAGAARTHG